MVGDVLVLLLSMCRLVVAYVLVSCWLGAGQLLFKCVFGVG